MFYFFQRGADFLQCEIRGDDLEGYVIVISEPGQPDRSEKYISSDAVYERWLQLQDGFLADGWWGPHGRD
jgi:hypothetical protein